MLLTFYALLILWVIVNYIIKHEYDFAIHTEAK